MGAILICNNGAASFETIHTTTKELSIHTRSMLQGLASIVALGHAVAATVYGVSHQGCGIVFGESLLVYTPDHDSPCCPDPNGRPLTYDTKVAESFRRFRLTSDPFVLDPPGCDPWERNLILYAGNITTLCNEFPLASITDAVCAFVYRENDPNCGGLDGRDYQLRSFESYDQAEAEGAVVTHYGGRDTFVFNFCGHLWC